MPKRKKLSQIIFSGELPETSGEKRQGLFRRLTSRFTGGHVACAPPGFAAAPAPAAARFAAGDAVLGRTPQIDCRDLGHLRRLASGRMSVGPSVARPTIDELFGPIHQAGRSGHCRPVGRPAAGADRAADRPKPGVAGGAARRWPGARPLLWQRRRASRLHLQRTELGGRIDPAADRAVPRARQVRFVFPTARDAVDLVLRRAAGAEWVARLFHRPRRREGGPTSRRRSTWASSNGRRRKCTR